MTQYSTKIKEYCKANGKVANFKPGGNVYLEDNGDGPFIHTWSIDGLAKPTTEQLNSYNDIATKTENNLNIDATRRTQYLSWQQQMEMVYKDQKNGTTTFKDHCDKVRSDNPKG